MANVNPRSVDPLVVGKVIGDVLDMFVPLVEFTVDYGSKKIANGVDIIPSSAAHKPSVHINASPASPNLYTLVSYLIFFSLVYTFIFSVTKKTHNHIRIELSFLCNNS